MTNLQQKLLTEGLTLKNYKEPLTPIPKKEGYGYYGTIMGTIDGKHIQCHACGKMYSCVQSHAFMAHKLNAKEYKEKYKLSYTTALISEDERETRKNRTIKYLAGLSIAELAERKRKSRENFQKYLAERGVKPGYPHRGISLEDRNKRGTCPDQLLDKIREVAKKLGHTPSRFEFIGETGTQRYSHLIRKVYGSWTNALKTLDMSPKQVVYKGVKHKHYSDDELLEYLSIFHQETGKIPTHTDFSRGLLPAYKIYSRRFKTIANARRLAGVPEPDKRRTGMKYNQPIINRIKEFFNNL